MATYAPYEDVRRSAIAAVHEAVDRLKHGEIIDAEIVDDDENDAHVATGRTGS